MPRQAYLDGFVVPLVVDPRGGLLGIINWAPNYGLVSNSRDDQSLASGQELDQGNQLPGMTMPARVAYINELFIREGFRIAVVKWTRVFNIRKYQKAGVVRGTLAEIGMIWDAMVVLTPWGLIRQNLMLLSLVTGRRRSRLVARLAERLAS